MRMSSTDERAKWLERHRELAREIRPDPADAAAKLHLAERTLERARPHADADPDLANGPTPGPEPGPGCFGKWRAGSVQLINETGLGPAGRNFFSQRAGDNSTINAENRATCAALD